jgi:hypothetical protein
VRITDEAVNFREEEPLDLLYVRRTPGISAESRP